MTDNLHGNLDIERGIASTGGGQTQSLHLKNSLLYCFKDKLSGKAREKEKLPGSTWSVRNGVGCVGEAKSYTKQYLLLW